MTSFEILDHTADVGIVAHGSTLEEVFASAAEAMFSLIVDIELVAEAEKREIKTEAANQEELLVAWLNELLYIVDTEGMVFRRFDIVSLTTQQLRAVAYGERVDASRHTLKTQVKAATYHLLRIERNNGFRAQVILDL